MGVFMNECMRVFVYELSVKFDKRKLNQPRDSSCFILRSSIQKEKRNKSETLPRISLIYSLFKTSLSTTLILLQLRWLYGTGSAITVEMQGYDGHSPSQESLASPNSILALGM